MHISYSVVFYNGYFSSNYFTADLKDAISKTINYIRETKTEDLKNVKVKLVQHFIDKDGNSIHHNNWYEFDVNERGVRMEGVHEDCPNEIVKESHFDEVGCAYSDFYSK